MNDILYGFEICAECHSNNSQSVTLPFFDTYILISPMFVYMYVTATPCHIYIYIYIYIYMCVCWFKVMYVCLHIYMYIYRHTYTPKYLRLVDLPCRIHRLHLCRG